MKLHLACGNRKIPGFVNIDIQESPAVDVVSDVADLPYEESSVDLIYSCCFIEHLGRNNEISFFRNTSWHDALDNWYKILKPGGQIYLATMDFEAVCKEYLQNKNLDQLLGILVGGQKNEEDLHGMIFDFKVLSDGMKNKGFKKVQRYNWWEFEPFVNDPKYDDFSAMYLPHMDKENGRLMTLNVRGEK
jgi:predicted SAM-dependent methyltransferase|tara:strand:+ start:36 stop:602 length:567 start_codon:yes stop_codon:yes gene_type:complete